jgi:translocation and assembly module TamA
MMPYVYADPGCGSGPSPRPAVARAILAGCTALLLALAVPPAAQAQTVSGYRVDLNGAGAMTSMLEDHLDIMRHRREAGISREEVERLVTAAPAQIRQLLATEGYFSPRIEPQLVQQEGRLVARFNIDPGMPTQIGSVDIRFSGAIVAGPHADPQRIARLRRRWSLKPGAVFKQEEWDEAKTELIKGLLVRDFPAARIADSTARIDPQQQRATLTVEVDSGPQFTFGELQVQGLNRYSRERIEALNPITPGETYSQEKLTELQARLQDSGYFSAAFATVEVDPAQPTLVPVRVDVTENKRHRLSAGVGFSTDNGAHVQARWLDRNFMSRDWLLESELRLDQKARLLGAELTFPRLDNGWRPSVGAHYEREDIENEINNKIRIDTRITNLVRANEQTWGISYIAERQRIEGIERNNRDALVGTYIYTRRRLNHPLTPTRGYVASIDLAAGPQGIINDSNIGRVHLRASWLSPARSRFQLIARGELGQAVGADRTELPSDLLFRAGGDRSVRGYAYNALGVELGDAVVGGRVLGVFSAELVYRFRPAWGIALFHDVGNAADRWQDFTLKQGSGIGARWSSPIGPVNLDLAVAHDTGDPRLHFSIGYGF